MLFDSKEIISQLRNHFDKCHEIHFEWKILFLKMLSLILFLKCGITCKFKIDDFTLEEKSVISVVSF